MDKQTLFRKTGGMEQVLGVRDCVLQGGKAQGTRAVELYNASGLSVTVLPGRGMDISSLKCKGINLSFLSKTGITASPYFTEDGARGFFRGFFAGFLTTGGLTYMGGACKDEGEPLGLHGVISNTPAYEVCPETVWEGGKPLLTVSGKVKEARVFGEHVVLSRRVTLNGEENSFIIEDDVENLDFAPTPLMLLYHMNFGYPLLSPACELHIPSYDVSPRDKEAESGLSELLSISAPIDGAKEQVFFHKIRPGRDKRAHVVLANKELKMGVELIYDPEALPFFTQWKCMKSGEYVLGLEPGTCHVMGRAQAKKDGSLRYLQPGKTKRVKIEVRVLTSTSEIRHALLCL